MKHSSGQFLFVSLVLSCSLTLQFRCLLFFCGPHPLSTPTSYQVTLFIQSYLSSFCAYNSPGNYNYSPGCSSVKIPSWAVLTLFRDWGRERKLSSDGVAVNSVMLILILSHLIMQVPVFWPTLFFYLRSNRILWSIYGQSKMPFHRSRERTITFWDFKLVNEVFMIKAGAGKIKGTTGKELGEVK